MGKLYYTAPPDEIFQEVKEKAAEVWEELGAHPNYTEEKLKRIDIKNIGDNMMYIVAMFDPNNAAKLSAKLSKKARKEIADRLKEVESHYYLIFR